MLSATLLVVMGLSLMVGPSGFSNPFVAGLKFYDPILHLRISRIFLALVAGTSLAASGTSLQALFQNPLADPHLFGISGGAALGACLVIALMPPDYALLPSLGAAIGGLLAFGLIYFIMTRWRSADLGQSILVGVLINAIAGGIITILKTLIPTQKIQSLLFWLVGSLAPLSPADLMIIVPVWILGLTLLLKIRGELEILSFGYEESRLLGVHVASVVKISIIANCLLVGMVVAYAGMIGFVGLVIPHFVRLFIAADVRTLMPISIFMGGICLVFFDTLSKWSFSLVHTEIPVGALTAVILSPIFFVLLIKARYEGNIEG